MEKEPNISPVEPEPVVAPPHAAQPEPTPQPEPYPFWSYADVVVFFGLAFPCILLGVFVVKVSLWLFHVRVHRLAFEAVSGQFLGYGFLFFTLYVLFKVHYERPFWSSLRWVRTRPGLPRIILLGFALAFGLSLLGWALKIPDNQTPLKQLLSDRSSLLLVSIFAVTAGPLCEELAFRGFLQPVLVRSFGAIAGIVLTAIPFGILHLWEYGNSWRIVLLITLAGIGFGWMRHVSGSTRAATVMHSAFNFFLVIGYFSPGRNLPSAW